MAQEHGSDHFLESVKNEQLICVNWHKNSVPDYFYHCSKIVLIIDPASEKWFHRALWYKHYGISNGKIHLKSHDPNYNTSAVRQYYQDFDNPILLDQSRFSFIKKNIIKSEQKKIFSSADNFNSQFQLKINLSDILDENKIVPTINQIYDHVGLKHVDSTVIQHLHKHWKSCHEFKYS